jgi:hypothetical protein
MDGFRDTRPIHNKVLTASGKLVARKRTYTVILVRTEDDSWKMYRCPDCSAYIGQYKGDLYREVPGETPTAFPVKIQCKNGKCGRKILFDYSVEQTGI